MTVLGLDASGILHYSKVLSSSKSFYLEPLSKTDVGQRAISFHRRTEAQMACLDWMEHRRLLSARFPCLPLGPERKTMSFPDDDELECCSGLVRADLEFIVFIFLLHRLVRRDFPDSRGENIPTRITRTILSHTGYSRLLLFFHLLNQYCKQKPEDPHITPFISQK